MHAIIRLMIDFTFVAHLTGAFSLSSSVNPHTFCAMLCVIQYTAATCMQSCRGDVFLADQVTKPSDWGTHKSTMQHMHHNTVNGMITAGRTVFILIYGQQGAASLLFPWTAESTEV
jgi:hypothetical protein